MGFERQGTPEQITVIATRDSCLKCGKESVVIINGYCPMCQDPTLDTDFEVKKEESKPIEGGK